MTVDLLVLVAALLVVGFAALTIGWALGQALCRRVVRGDLWTLYYAVAPDDTVPAQVKYDLLGLIKRLEW